MKRTLVLFTMLATCITIGVAYRHHRRTAPKRKLLHLAEQAGWPVSQVEYPTQYGALLLCLCIGNETVALQMLPDGMFGVAWYMREGGKKYRDNELSDRIRTANPTYETFQQNKPGVVPSSTSDL